MEIDKFASVSTVSSNKSKWWMKEYEEWLKIVVNLL
jgi:hypothetical protein